MMLHRELLTKQFIIVNFALYWRKPSFHIYIFIKKTLKEILQRLNVINLRIFDYQLLGIYYSAV